MAKIMFYHHCMTTVLAASSASFLLYLAMCRLPMSSMLKAKCLIAFTLAVSVVVVVP